MASVLTMMALLAVALAATAAEPQRAGATSAAQDRTRQAVAQKDAFVRRLLDDSPAANRIARSGNAEARKFMAAAREYHAKAAALLQSGDAAGADRALNEALWMIGKARQLVPDTMYRAIEQRVRYAQLLASIESLHASYQRHLSHLGRNEREDARWTAVAQRIEQAKSLANAEQVAEAVRVLLQAEYDLLAAFGAVLRTTTTLDYTLHFADPAEEFRFELERNRSYGELIPLALRELKPTPEAMRLIERYVESNIALRDAAQQHAARKNYRAALSSIRDGTGYLQRALSSAGLVVPQEMTDQ